VQELLELLERWQGSWVSARIVTARDDLVVVCRGRLGPLSDEKHPAYFWPLANPGEPAAPETAGVYLHPERCDGIEIHPGEVVAEYRQDGVTVNLRRLDHVADLSGD
jgi:hypothetical protein